MATFSAKSIEAIKAAKSAAKKRGNKGAGWKALLQELKGVKLKKPSAPKDTAFEASYNRDFPVVAQREKKSSMPNWLLPAIGIAAITFFTLRKRK